MPVATEPSHLLTAMAFFEEPIGKTKLLTYLNVAKIKTDEQKVYTPATLQQALDLLKKQKVLCSSNEGYSLAPQFLKSNPSFLNTALTKAHEEGYLDRLCAAASKCRGVLQYWGGSLRVRSYAQALGGLRVALLGGESPNVVSPWLNAVIQHRDYAGVHPFISLCGSPFNPVLFERIHPDIQSAIMSLFLASAADWENAEVVNVARSWASEVCRNNQNGDIAAFLVMDRILSGRLEEALELPMAQSSLFQGMIAALQGRVSDAIVQLETALKEHRKATGKRSAILPGMSGYCYVLALLRSPDPKHHRQADSFLTQALKQSLSEEEMLVFGWLHSFQQIQAGLCRIEDIATPKTRYPLSALSELLLGFIFYWLDLPTLKKKTGALIRIYRTAEANGLYWLSDQASGLLSVMGEDDYAERAKAPQSQDGFEAMLGWFAKQESWQRQLTALSRLNDNGSAGSASECRLVWLLTFTPKSQAVSLEPREQKRSANGQWTKGRPLALRRLHYDADQIDYLTSQDRQALKAIERSFEYYGSSYELNGKKALVALMGHPYVYRHDAPEVRVEILKGEPELLVKREHQTLHFSLHPEIHAGTDIVIQQETPTRLRVIQATEEHRRIAAIIGSSFTAPVTAEEQVLQVLGSIAPLITVHSDIGGQATDLEQVEADGALHALLLPNQQGLKMQLRVRPFENAGAYYAPGQGSRSVIAEVEGKTLQAIRDLPRELRTMQDVLDACPALNQGTLEHEEWWLGDPEDALELLLQLQAQTDRVRISWPEGEKFKLAGPRLDASRFRMSIHGERDWFAVQGELQLDENRVLDLQKLLGLIRQSPGRFIALGNDEFLALTDAFQRRLEELAALSETRGKNLKVHSLAAFALEELSDGLGQLEVDKQWKQHLQRLRKLDDWQPEVPGTLQAELRDYQVDGFRWLSRLAHWGVGACLADDMGLGKTIQLLALLLERAANGPALVIAPTSVCTNWISEMARFAPTLQPILFGTGDREQTLSDLKPFDVLVVSYGLLQQEAERFAPLSWHTLILDEAQAIKNAQTLRSDAVMALSADFRLIATGTPLENHLGELWNLFRFINPGLLGSLKQFNERFAGPIERQQDSAVRQRLKRLIQPFILRRTKSQVLSELPSRTEILHSVDPSPEETVLYEALRRSALEKLAGLTDAPAGQRQIQVLAEMMKLRRACCNPNLVAPELGLTSSKLAAFGELLEELLDNRHKALVFSQFVDHLTLIREYLDAKGVAYQYLDGATPMRERKKRVDAFQAGHGDVFLISLKAGGTGLNLTAADYVIHMDPWWNPAVEDQASDRAYRMGQKRPVTIYRLVAKNTIEASIVNLHAHKRDLADSLLEDSDAASRLSAQDMIALLQEQFAD